MIPGDYGSTHPQVRIQHVDDTQNQCFMASFQLVPLAVRTNQVCKVTVSRFFVSYVIKS